MIDNIVKVTIQRGTIQVSRRGFGVPMILSTHSVFAGRIEYYSSLDEMVTAGFLTTSEEYKAAALLFSQKFKVERLAVGRIDAGDADIAASLTAVKAEDDDWYAFLLLDRTEAEVLGASAWVETEKKIFALGNDEAAVKDGTAGNLFEDIAALNRVRTIGLYSGVAGSVWSEAAWMGRCLPLDPGSLTWKFKTLSGVVADNLTSGEIANIDGNNGNTYTTVGGVDMTAEGKVFSGEFIDIIRFTDFLQARIEENVFSVLVNQEKVPYTQKGIAQIEAPLRAALQEGVRVGGLASPDGILPPFTITVPDILNVPTADKTARELKNIAFTAYLAGAIHLTEIDGILSV